MAQRNEQFSVYLQKNKSWTILLNIHVPLWMDYFYF